MKPLLKIVTPAGDLRTVTAAPGRKANASYRPREYLTPGEVALLVKAARANRHGQRDAALILVAYHHGLRVSEIAALEWSDIDFDAGSIAVRRLKGGASGSHPIEGGELRALRALRRTAGNARYVFQTERGGPFSRAGLNKLIERLGRAAKLPFAIHPHMLRHACGYALINRDVDVRTLQSYLGHRSITSTARYSELAEGKFKGLWS
jgi:integrase